MRSLIFILFVLFLTVSFSCSNSKNSDPQPSNAKATIIGNWILQKQHVVLYDNKVLIGDTIVNSSKTITATTQFNNDGTYQSVSSFPGASGPSGINSHGNYTYSDSSFDVVPVLAGWYGFYITSPPPGNDTLQAKVTLLTLSSLNIHCHIVGNYVIDGNNVVHNYDEQMDYYYIKP
jgi:hypothetical protein